jgi:hypothetical protein
MNIGKKIKGERIIHEDKQLNDCSTWTSPHGSQEQSRLPGTVGTGWRLLFTFVNRVF